jgi:hypothetical protein
MYSVILGVCLENYFEEQARVILRREIFGLASALADEPGRLTAGGINIGRATP